MQAIGFGFENGTEYVTIKNSWGTGWGEKGYARVSLTQDTMGTCQLYK
jgi:C1A family cysteine protease